LCKKNNLKISFSLEKVNIVCGILLFAEFCDPENAVLWNIKAKQDQIRYRDYDTVLYTSFNYFLVQEE